MQQLQVLSLNNNSIRSIPDAIADMPALEELAMCSNDLRVLPAALGALPRLHTLRLDWNALVALPPELANAPLRHLSLESNPLLLPPMQVMLPRRQRDRAWRSRALCRRC